MKKKIIILIVVAAVIGGVVFFRIAGGSRGKFIAVKTISASVGDVKSYLSTTVTIKSKNSKDYYGPQAKVLKVNIKLGDSVKKGDVLVTYDVNDPNATAKQAQIAYDNAVSSKNDALNQDSKNAAKLSDQSVDNQINDYTNRLNIVKDKISSLESEIATSSDSAKINDDKVLLYGNAAAVNQIPTPNIVPGNGSLYSTRDSLLSTLNGLKNNKISLQPTSTDKMKQLDNAIANAKISLDNATKTAGLAQTNIVADFDGVVTTLNAVAGNTASATSGPAVTVQDVNNLVGQAMLGKYDANKVKLEETATVNNGVKDFNGKVSYIASAATKSASATGGDSTLQINIDITDKPEGLKIDFTQDAEILLGEKSGVLTIPADCIKADKSGNTFVYVIEGKKAVQKTVTLGLQSDVAAEVLSGISASDIVISNPSADIQDGSIVKAGGK